MPDNINRLTFLWRGAQYQDSLLQAYRSIHFTMQSVLLATGAALSAGTILARDRQKAWAVYVLLVIVTVLAFRLLHIMRKLIMSRRDDVNYFHHHILETEKEIAVADERVLTQFKAYQKFHKSNNNPATKFLVDPLSEPQRQQLLEKDKEHTRQLLDANVSVYLLIVWALFHAIVALTAIL